MYACIMLDLCFLFLISMLTQEIVRECPPERQTLLFSATMPSQLLQFSRAGLRDPQLIRLDTDHKMSEELRMAFFLVRSNEKVGQVP
jgi:ATP-dependent RNA helicase DDX54/DBP10